MKTSKDRISVLVVDDDPEDVDLLKDVIMDMRSYEVDITWASSYEQAFRRDLDSFDVILLDVHLGARSGLELLKAFRDLQTRAPIILLTGLDDPRVDSEASSSGAADYLVKGTFNALTLERSLRYSMAWGRLVDELRQKETNQRRLIDAVFDGLVVHDQAGLILRVNESAAKLLGEDSASLVGRSLCDWLDPDDLKHGMRGAEHPKTRECEVTNAQGTRTPIEWQCRSLWHDGKEAVLTCLRDITQQKQMQAQLLQRERLATAGLLASSLAHEIGTPLAVMRGRAEMLGLSVERNNGTVAHAQRNVGIIVEQIDRIARLIRTLLNFMRGQDSQETQAVRVRDALSDALELVAGELRVHDIKVDTTEVQNDAMVRADADGLRQVFVNLLVNAVHAIAATQGPQPKSLEEAKAAEIVAPPPRNIVVSTTPLNHTQWAITVTDTGCGISQTNLEQIFVPFFTTKHPSKGTGLGLAIVQRSVTTWGGHIDVESQEGVGTTFTLRLPLAETP